MAKKASGEKKTTTRKRPTAEETVERHQEIVRLRLRGLTWAQIVERTGMADRQVREVWYEWSKREKSAMVEEDPLDVVMEQIAGLRELRSMAANVFEEAEGALVEDKETKKVLMIGRSPSARVGALRLMMDLRAREIDLRQETGLLPRNLGKFQVEIDVRYVVDQIVQIMVKYDMPPAAQDEMLQLLEREPERASIAAA